MRWCYVKRRVWERWSCLKHEGKEVLYELEGAILWYGAGRMVSIAWDLRDKWCCMEQEGGMCGVRARRMDVVM